MSTCLSGSDKELGSITEKVKWETHTLVRATKAACQWRTQKVLLPLVNLNCGLLNVVISVDQQGFLILFPGPPQKCTSLRLTLGVVMWLALANEMWVKEHVHSSPSSLFLGSGNHWNTEIEPPQQQWQSRTPQATWDGHGLKVRNKP